MNWKIDPSISVGLVVNKRVVIGIVFAPIIGRLYTAIKGKGAKLNGKPIKVTFLSYFFLKQSLNLSYLNLENIAEGFVHE